MAENNDFKNNLLEVLKKHKFYVSSDDTDPTEQKEPSYCVHNIDTNKVELWYEDGRENPRKQIFEYMDSGNKKDWCFFVNGNSNKQRGMHYLSKLSKEEIIALLESLQPRVFNDFSPNFIQI